MVERERGLDEQVRCAVERLGAVRRGASLGFALDVGRIVIDTLYGGDLSAWRRRERKDTALRALSRQRDLPLSTSALYRALALYELSRRGEGTGVGFERLHVSHLRAVLGLSPEVQDRLLTAADREKWTVARLEREALALRSRGSRGGRKPVATYVKSIRRILQLTSPEALQGLEDCSKLGPDQLEELATQLARARARLERIEHVLPRPARARAAQRA